MGKRLRKIKLVEVKLFLNSIGDKFVVYYQYPLMKTR